MNAPSLSVPERGLILLIGVALLASGGLLYLARDRQPSAVRSEPVVLENVVIVRPTFHDARKVDLNTAAVEDLVRLPGIGEVLAGRIIAYREEHGRFTSVEGIVAVNGIGPKVLEEIRELVTIAGEEEEAPGGQ